MEKYYSIHDIVTFKVVGKVGRRFEIEYKNFESEEIEHPDITIYLGRFTPSKEGCQLLDSRYFIRHDYLYYEDSYKIGRWRLELSGFESGSIVARLHTNTVGSIMADMFICAYTIDPLIRFVMNEKGYSDKDAEHFMSIIRTHAGQTIDIEPNLSIRH